MENMKIDENDLQCIKCGYCCSSYTIKVPVESKTFEAIKGVCKETRFLPFKKIVGMEILLNGECEFFDGKCKDYPNRPQRCKDYFCWKDKESIDYFSKGRYFNDFIIANARRLVNDPYSGKELFEKAEQIRDYFKKRLDKKS